MFGCYTPRPGILDFRIICRPVQSQSRIWFNAWDSIPERQVKYVAFDESCAAVKRLYPTSLMPTIPFTGTQANEPWLFSSCSTNGASEIVICRDTSVGHRPIIGMLLRYVNGHTACVGQFRFDMSLETIRIEVDGVIYLSSQRTEQRFLYVSDVTVDPPSSDTCGRSWLDIHRDGLLEWWFSNRHTIVRYASMESA